MGEDGGSTVRSRIAALPRVDAVRAVTGPARWKAVWSIRHTVTFVVLLPVLGALYWLAAGALTGSVVPAALVLLGAVVGAGIAATYVPLSPTPIKDLVRSGVCGVVPGLAVIAVPTLLAQQSTSGLAFSLAILGMAGARRAFGSESC